MKKIEGYIKIDVPGFKLAVVQGKHNSPQVNIHWLCSDCKKWNIWDDECMCCNDPAFVTIDGILVEQYSSPCDYCESGSRIGEFLHHLYHNAKDVWWKKIDEVMPDAPNGGHLYVEAVK